MPKTWTNISVCAFFTAAPAVLSCSTSAVEGGAVCSYGEIRQCEADGGCQGRRTCLPDLSGFSACVCHGDAGADASADGEAGATPP